MSAAVIWRIRVLLVALAVACFVTFAGHRPRAALAALPTNDTPLAEAAAYVGSSLCQACHAQAGEALAKTGHRRLVAGGAAGPEVAGCESCHGPGGEHVGSTGKKPIGQTFAEASADDVRAACGKCHLKEAGAAEGQPWELDPNHWRKSRHSRKGLSCLSCHNVHGGAEHSLRQPTARLCVECHKTLVKTDGGYTHRPVADGKCTLCHDPHGSGVPNDVVQTIGDSCRSCHPVGAPGFADAHARYSMEQSSCVSCHSPHSFDRGKALLGKNQHTPFAARRCSVCHQGGAGSRPSLIKPQKELCLGCHPASSIMPAKNAEGTPMVQHSPVTQGLCTTCHNPHATDHPNHLKAKLDQTCFLCHGKVEEATLSLHEHAPVATGNCLLCHEGHTSPEAHLLNRPPIQLCESCHTTQGRFSHPVGLQNGRTVRDPNTGGMLVCASCHAVHGSDTGYLLPQEETALCRSCHSK